MKDCDHVGHEFYARITVNNHNHFCIQCDKCHDKIKSDKHGGRLYIKPSEIPFGAVIKPLIERKS